jgi:putative hydrolase of the HAD superfamily
MSVRAVSFDVGQVLLAFDAAYLAEKLARFGHAADPAAIDREAPAAWEEYGRSLREGRGHGAEGWTAFVRRVARGGGAEVSDETLAFLLADQREHNMWRRPVPGMHELVHDLAGRGVPVIAVSNSEGALRTLLSQAGLLEAFAAVADSGLLGIEKPSPGIFQWAAAQIHVDTDELVHVGDSWTADVEGAHAVGAQAIWFPKLDDRPLPPRTQAARTADEVRAAIEALLLPVLVPRNARRRPIRETRAKHLEMTRGSVREA